MFLVCRLLLFFLVCPILCNRVVSDCQECTKPTNCHPIVGTENQFSCNETYSGKSEVYKKCSYRLKKYCERQGKKCNPLYEQRLVGFDKRCAR